MARFVCNNVIQSTTKWTDISRKLMIWDWWQSLLFSLIPSQRTIFNKKKKKPTLKINNAASTGSHGKYTKYVSFPWPSVVAAHDRKRLVEHSKAVEATGSIKKHSHTQYTFMSSRSYRSIQTVQMMVSGQKWFAKTTKKAQGQMLKHVWI